jgi:hypothetical protein
MKKNSLTKEEYQKVKNLSSDLLNEYEVKKVSAIMRKKFYDEGRIEPDCVNPGCINHCVAREWKYWSFKTECSTCMRYRKLKQYVIEDNIKYVVDKHGNKNGIIIHKESFCENFDGHLGFLCPVPKDCWDNFQSGLDLDHVDGNHYNNDPSNIRTYCKLCHGRKSLENNDCNSNKPSSRSIE